MRKNKFFDTIMIALVLLIAVKVMFPNALGGSSPSTDNPDAPAVDMSHMVELPIFDTIDDAGSQFESQAILDSPYYYGFDENAVNDIITGTTPCAGRFYSTVDRIPCSISMDNPDVASMERDRYSVGIPVFYVGNDLYYLHTLLFAPDYSNWYISFDILEGEHYYFPYYFGA